MTDAPMIAGPGEPAPESPDGPFAAPGYESRLVRRWAVIVTVVLGIAYLLLQNPYWVPSGDADFYVSIARTMARGGPFEYNGLPVAITPPGWPWVMAKVMQLSPTFMALKLVTMTFMLGSLVLSYFIALRFLRPATAGVATVLCGLLMPLYSLTYFLHSEGLYCLLSAAALLLALRLREGRGRLPGRIALIGICVTIPLVRWAGVFQLLPIVAVLLSGGRERPWAIRHWKTALACTLVITGTWLGTRYALKLTDEQAKAIREAGGSSMMESETDEVPSEVGPVTIIPVTKGGQQSIAAEYAQRVVHAGKWFSWLLWQPSRFASVSKGVDAVVTAVGWVVILMLGGMAWLEFRRGEYLWASLALYCGGLCVNWPNPNSRYFVPVAPLIIVGLFNAIRWGRVLLPTGSFDGWKWLRRGLVYSILLCNLAMYGVDVIVMRSTRFYDVFEAGQHKDLIDIAHYMMALPPLPEKLTTFPYGAQFRPDDGDIMINERYENLGRPKFSKAGSRSLVLLTDRFVKPLEQDKRLYTQLKPPFSVRLGSTMRRRGCEWLLIQAPSVPWRVWHFRLPQSIYQKIAKDPDATPSGGWTLYNFQREDRSFVQQPVPPIDGWPTRVPGM